MTRRLLWCSLGLALAAAPAARAQNYFRGGPVYVRPGMPGPTGPSLFTGAFAPSFYDGRIFSGYRSFAGAGFVPVPNFAPTNIVVQPTYVSQPVFVNSNPILYNPPPPPRQPGTLSGGPVVGGILPADQQASAGSLPPPTDGAARFTVKLPADAKLWVDQFASQQTGPVRTYNTPFVLQPGKTYEYTFRAQWGQGGQTVTRDKPVRFKAGNDLTVDFDQDTPR